MGKYLKTFKNTIQNSRFFARNTMPKVISILFAMVMWLYVMGEVNPQSSIEFSDIKVQLLNTENLKQTGLVIMGQKDFDVNVKISGRRNDIYKITSQDIIARADLRGYQEGENSIPVEVSIPPKAEIVDITPKQIKIKFDKIVKRQKTIVVRPIGTTAEGFEPSEAMAVPSEAIVEGPETLVNSVTMVVADVNVKGKKKDIIDRLPLKPMNIKGKEVSGVEVKNKYVEVTQPILRIKEVPISIQYKGTPKTEFKITDRAPTKNTVLIKGREEIINNITQIYTQPVRLDEFDQSKKIKLNLITPEGVTTPYVDKELSVFVTIEKIKSKEFIFNRAEIGIENLDDQYVVDMNRFPEKVKVKVNVIESLFKNINKEDVKVYVDAKGLEEGLYYIDIFSQVGKKVENVKVIPEKLDLMIKKSEEIPPVDETLEEDLKKDYGEQIGKNPHEDVKKDENQKKITQKETNEDAKETFKNIEE